MGSARDMKREAAFLVMFGWHAIVPKTLQCTILFDPCRRLQCKLTTLNLYPRPLWSRKVQTSRWKRAWSKCKLTSAQLRNPS